MKRPMKIACVVALSVVEAMIAGCDLRSETCKTNTSGSYSFSYASPDDGLLKIRIRDGKERATVVKTRASVYQKFDAAWIDETTILVASSDIGFFAVDVSGKCVDVEVLKAEEGKYHVHLLDEKKERIKTIVVGQESMPRSAMLKHVKPVSGLECEVETSSAGLSASTRL